MFMSLILLLDPDIGLGACRTLKVEACALGGGVNS